MNQAVTPLEMKTFIIETLALEDVRPDDIGDDEPLFGEGLGLDSIDGLELDIALRKKFQIPPPEEKTPQRDHLASVRALIAFVNEKTQTRA
ncbi:MAG: phosphopantetheine-binding protein [Firmicutes bacterium]|nr:phosphopantetheine-binding protein [Bacillota bacterium]